jgi:hypothetical protein
MRRVFIWVPPASLLMILVTLACHSSPSRVSESQHPIPLGKVDKSRLANLRSPHDIERYINDHSDDADLREIWEAFGIDSQIFEPVRCGCRDHDCPGLCTAETINLSSMKSDEGYVLLRLCHSGESECGFLLFKKEEPWKYLGLAYSSGNQYEPPQHKIVENGQTKWLVIKELWGRGTGVVQYGERWHTLGEKGVKRVLSYPVSGHSVQGTVKDYRFQSNVLQKAEQQSFVVTIRYTESGNPRYRNDREWLESRSRWSSFDKYQLCFVWEQATGNFILDEKKSVMSKAKDDPIRLSLFANQTEQ